MKKVLKWLETVFKVGGIYFTIFLTAIVLLGFEKKVTTPMTTLECDEYKEFLKADSITMYRSFYGSIHYEIVVEKIEEESIISRTLLFVDKFKINEKRFLYLSISESLYVVVNDDNEVWTEKAARQL